MFGERNRIKSSLAPLSSVPLDGNFFQGRKIIYRVADLSNLDYSPSVVAA
jgi:hypothetical protein